MRHFLYICYNFADIILVLGIISLVFVLLIFPIFVNVKIFFLKDIKKIFFGIYIFNKIKIKSGYANFIKEGICIHLSKRKAIILKYKNLLNFKKGIAVLRDYDIISIYAVQEIGNVKNVVLPFSETILTNFVSNLIAFYVYNKKQFIKVNNRYEIYLDKNVFNIYLKSTIILNFTVIIFSLLKIILKKVICR